jgi:Cu+-exporting ATPase
MSCCSTPTKDVTNSAKDPVCGMQVNPKTTPHKSEYKGASYFFCGAGCKDKFDASPSTYVTDANCCA